MASFGRTNFTTCSLLLIATVGVDGCIFIPIPERPDPNWSFLNVDKPYPTKVDLRFVVGAFGPFHIGKSTRGMVEQKLGKAARMDEQHRIIAYRQLMSSNYEMIFALAAGPTSCRTCTLFLQFDERNVLCRRAICYTLPNNDTGLGYMMTPPQPVPTELMDAFAAGEQ